MRFTQVRCSYLLCYRSKPSWANGTALRMVASCPVRQYRASPDLQHFSLHPIGEITSYPRLLGLAKDVVDAADAAENVPVALVRGATSAARRSGPTLWHDPLNATPEVLNPGALRGSSGDRPTKCRL